MGWIPKGGKSTDFDQRPWATAHGFEQGRFGLVLRIVPNFLKCLLCACKWISNYFRDCSRRFGVNSEGSEIHRFNQKPWVIAHGFEQGRFRQVLGIVPNSLKCPLLASKCICKCFRDCSWRFWGEFRRVRNPPILNKKPGLQPMVLNRADLVWFLESFQSFWNVSYVRANRFPTTFGIVPEDLGWIPKGGKSTDFHQKPWAIAHGFEQGRFRQVLGIVPNCLKSPLLACKCICKCFRDCSRRYGFNSEGCEIHRFWPKTLGYSPWFWTGPI